MPVQIHTNSRDRRHSEGDREALKMARYGKRVYKPFVGNGLQGAQVQWEFTPRVIETSRTMLASFLLVNGLTAERLTYLACIYSIAQFKLKVKVK